MTHDAKHRYAPRSTTETRSVIAYPRFRPDAGTAPTPCVHCDAPVYVAVVFEAYTDDLGREHAEVTQVVDCGPDVGGTAPTATTAGHGIRHQHVCGLVRPLPATTPDPLASSTHNVNTKRRDG